MDLATKLPAEICVTEFMGRFEQNQCAIEQWEILRRQDSLALDPQGLEVVCRHLQCRTHDYQPKNGAKPADQFSDYRQRANQELIRGEQRKADEHEIEQRRGHLALASFLKTLEQLRTVGTPFIVEQVGKIEL